MEALRASRRRLEPVSLPSAMKLSSLLPRSVVAACSAVLASFAPGSLWVDDGACPSPGSGGADGHFCRIQDAIDAALDGDLVLVAPGHYFETIDFRGKAIAVVAVAGPAATVIDAAGAGSVVRFQTHESGTSQLRGFTIQNGFCLGAGCHAGGGIACVGASPTIEGNSIRSNFSLEGGGIYCESARPVIIDNVVVGNQAEIGGGICLVSGSDAQILGNEIAGNCAIPGGGRGGGLYSEASAPLVRDNRIVGNSALGDPFAFGAGAYFDASEPTLLGNVVAENALLDLGGNFGAGVYVRASKVRLTSDTVTANVAGPGRLAASSGGGVHVEGLSTLLILGTILLGNTAELGSDLFVGPRSSASGAFSALGSGADVAVAAGGSFVQGTGVLRDVDPLFADAGASDYHLLPSSPLVDAGAPGSLLAGVDLDGDPRILDGRGDGFQRLDIGADELNRVHLSASATPVVGSSLVLHTGGPAGFAHLLALSPGTADVPRPPFGSLLLDAQVLLIVAAGPLPSAKELAVPLDEALVGVRVFAQALAVDTHGPSGSFTNRLDLRVAAAAR